MTSQESLKVHVFRIQEGLGNACLLQFPDDTCGIVDWGTRRKEPMEAALKIAGSRGFRFVAASHAHADHSAGLAAFLRECAKRQIPVGRFLYPASTLNKENAYLTKARVAADECGIRMSSIGVDPLGAPPAEWKPPYLVWADDMSWEVRVLSPALTDIAVAELRALKKSGVPGNETSLVVLFRFVGQDTAAGMGRALLPGDATPATLDFARQTAARFPGLTLDNQMFLVPHHGSRHNLPAWLSNHTKGIAVVSSRTDSLQHPSQLALQSLRQWTGNSAIFCTSYAKCCSKAFGKQALGAAKALVKPGSCFGDLVISVSRNQPAQFVSSTDAGDRRRQFGYCR